MFIKIIFLNFMFLCFSIYASSTEHVNDIYKEQLIKSYKVINEVLPDEKVSIVDIINSSTLYESLSKSSHDDTSRGIFNKLIQIMNRLETQSDVSVILKIQSPYYPEGFLSEEETKKQRQSILNILIPIINNRLLGENEILSSMHIFDTIPHFSVLLNKNNIWKLLESNGIIDIELNETSKPALFESTNIIDASSVWGSGNTGSGVAVAVLDTGVRKTHEFFSSGTVVSEGCYSGAQGIYSSRSFCPGGVSATTISGSGLNCSNSIDGCDHGTHVAGIIAGKRNSDGMSGVAPDAKIIALQVFSNVNGEALSYTNDQIKALERVYALKDTYLIAAVNMSLGGGAYTSYCNSDSRKAIIDTLLSVNIATVIASGNNSYNHAISQPGCIETAITVGATSDGGYGSVDTVTPYSNSNALIDLLAPGSLITAPVSTSNSSYGSKHGTSMATPHVAGAFALLKSTKNNLTVEEGLNALTISGVDVTDSDNNITKKRIDVYNAVSSLGTGSITVNLIPSSGKWKIDDSSWQNSGTTLSDLLLGEYKVSLEGITHLDSEKVYVTPTSQTVTLSSNGDSETLNLTYLENDKPDKFQEDFNGDGKSDILIRKTDGSYYIAIMDSTTATASRDYIKKPDGSSWTAAPSTWTYLGMGDFNADGKSDILIRRSNGSYYVAIMDSTTATSSRDYIKKPDGSTWIASPSTWTYLGMADFNGDGKSDILIRKADGSYYIAIMDGTTITDSRGYIKKPDGSSWTAAPSTWTYLGMADFNADGKSDILIRRSNGSYYIAIMDSTTATESRDYIKKPDGSSWTAAPSTWTYLGMADFNADGKSDILIRKADGSYYIAIMDSTTATASRSYIKKPNGSTWIAAPSTWTYLNTSDYNGDGKSDILIRKADGSYYVAIMEGTTITDSRDYIKKPDGSSWTAAPSTWTKLNIE
jgi:subtilisin family serine protease